MARPDVLLVSLGTTLGWRVSDAMLQAQLERAGARTELVSVGLGAATRLRRGYPVNDLVEMYAARRTVRTAVVRAEPRVLVVSSTTAAMLLPSLPVPYAIRFDAPARLNRPGPQNSFLHALERRAMRRALLTMPLSVAGAEELPEGAAPPLVVPAPIDPSAPDGGEPPERERLAVAYVPDPKAKGLELVVGGWAAAVPADARLEVYGLDPEWARSHLRRTGTPLSGTVELRGTVPAPEFRARLRRAHAFVHGARWEDLGQAPLEALADGALLATVPSGGPYEAGRLARRLEPALVAEAIDADALAAAIRAAFDLSEDASRAYREKAAELLRPYRSEAVQETVSRELLPALLAPTPPHPPPGDAAP